jgi:rod shape-determining protein MreD
VLRTQAATFRETGDPATSLRGQTLLRVTGMAAGATLAAMVEVAVAHALPPGAPRPHLALIVVVTLALVSGLESTAIAALAGGAALDVLAFRPLGLTASGLLLVGGATAAVASPLTGMRRTVGLVAVVPAAIVLGLLAAVGSPMAVDAVDAVRGLLPGAATDLALALPLGFVGLAVRRHLAKEAAPSH